MTGTVSRTATASLRGGVGRKPQAKLRPEEHEAHMRRRREGEGAKKPEAQCHPDRVGVDATGRWSESHASYPGRPRPTPVTGDVRLSGWPRTERGVSRGHSSGAHSREGSNERSRTGPMGSRGEGDAGTRAEKPERPQEASGGTAHGLRNERQARAARSGAAEDEARSLIDEVLRRENLVAAHARVVSNGGAPGIDGMTVEALEAHCREHWPRIR